MLRIVLARRQMAAAPPKFKRPFHLMASLLRTAHAEIDHPWFLIEFLEEAGHLPFAWSPPNGYPDSEGYWSGFMLPRWNFATVLLEEDWTDVSVDVSHLDASMSVSRIVAAIDRQLTGGDLSSKTKGRLKAFLRSGRVTPRRIRQTFGLAFASPDFQQY